MRPGDSWWSRPGRTHQHIMRCKRDFNTQIESRKMDGSNYTDGDSGWYCRLASRPGAAAAGLHTTATAAANSKSSAITCVTRNARLFYFDIGHSDCRRCHRLPHSRFCDLVFRPGYATDFSVDLAEVFRAMKHLDAPNIIHLPRTQYAIRPKRSRWQRIKARFSQAAALASVAAVVAGVVISTLTPDLFPIPA